MNINIEKTIIQELIRFIIVGSIAVIIQFIVYYMLVNIISHNISLTVSYLVSLIFNYIMTTLFTFHVKPNKNNGFGFLGSHIINFSLQFLFLNLFVWFGIAKQWAIIPVFAICFPINFLLIKKSMKNG